MDRLPRFGVDFGERDGQLKPRCTRPTSLNSTVIHSAAYDDETEELTIRLRTGRIYTYRAVGEWVYDELCAAESAGRFYNLRIRDAFAYSRGYPARTPVRAAAAASGARAPASPEPVRAARPSATSARSPRPPRLSR